MKTDWKKKLSGIIHYQAEKSFNDESA